jgi:hypothetical protein
MQSKALHRFKERISYYEADLELADLLSRTFKKTKNTDDKLGVALGGNEESHPKLDNRVNSQRTRDILAGHFMMSFLTAFIKELHEDFSEYLATILNRAALAGLKPEQLVHDAKIDIQAKQILEAGSWEKVISAISEKIFRSLENERNTKKLVEKIGGRLGLKLKPNILEGAMPYLDARHIFVHRDGSPDKYYTDSYPTIKLKNGKIWLDLGFARSARHHIILLAEHIDSLLMTSGLLRPQDSMGGNDASAARTASPAKAKPAVAKAGRPPAKRK